MMTSSSLLTDGHRSGAKEARMLSVYTSDVAKYGNRNPSTNRWYVAFSA